MRPVFKVHSYKDQGILRRRIENTLYNYNILYLHHLFITCDELMTCSAKLHFRDSDQQKVMTNCSQYLEVIQSIYGNDFGFCFTFQNINNNILLKNRDYIQLKMNFEIENNFYKLL